MPFAFIVTVAVAFAPGASEPKSQWTWPADWLHGGVGETETKSRSVVGRSSSIVTFAAVEGPSLWAFSV